VLVWACDRDERPEHFPQESARGFEPIAHRAVSARTQFFWYYMPLRNDFEIGSSNRDQVGLGATTQAQRTTWLGELPIGATAQHRLGTQERNAPRTGRLIRSSPLRRRRSQPVGGPELEITNAKRTDARLQPFVTQSAPGRTGYAIFSSLA